MEYAFLAVLFIYLTAALFYILRLVFGYAKFSAIGLRCVVLGAVVQLTVLVIHLIRLQGTVSLGYLEYFQLSSLFLAILFIVLCFSKRFYGSGPFFITLIVVFCLLSFSLHTPSMLSQLTRGSGYLLLHMVFLFLSLVVFSVSFVVAIMFLLSEWQIKQKRLKGITARFPPLQVLDHVHYRSLYTGFVLFTLVIITGAGFAKIKTGHYISADLKQVLGIVSWLFFAALLNLRAGKGLSGHRGVVLSLIGCVSIIISFILGFSR
ncbi:MAG: cytochrome c biogenesis protein CcsA [Deltaproteobacteria bacterium]|nr:cytochrome c biogenesis protein CcsA [Deltaproteobacteria bacterium]